MSKIKTPLTVSNVETWENLRRYCAQFFGEIVSTINGRLTFSENMDTYLTTATFGVSVGITAAVQIPHTLNRVPTGYIVYKQSAALNVYDGGTANTDKNLYLKSGTTGTIGLIIF